MTGTGTKHAEAGGWGLCDGSACTALAISWQPSVAKRGSGACMRPAADLDRWDYSLSVRERLGRAAGFEARCQLPFCSTGPVRNIDLHRGPGSDYKFTSQTTDPPCSGNPHTTCM